MKKSQAQHVFGAMYCELENVTSENYAGRF